MIDDKVKAGLLASVIVLGLLMAGQYWMEHRIFEPFSELGVLGPNQKIGDYPTNVTAGQSVTLYGYVGNHEGVVTYYDVKVKQGPSSAIVNESTWASLPSSYDYRVVLRDGENSTFSLQLRFSNPASNAKILFELWELDVASGGFRYSGLWGQIVLNVTSP
jgi:uncharacterized membrane protein